MQSDRIRQTNNQWEAAPNSVHDSCTIDEIVTHPWADVSPSRWCIIVIMTTVWLCHYLLMPALAWLGQMLLFECSGEDQRILSNDSHNSWAIWCCVNYDWELIIVLLVLSHEPLQLSNDRFMPRDFATSDAYSSSAKHIIRDQFWCVVMLTIGVNVSKSCMASLLQCCCPSLNGYDTVQYEFPLHLKLSWWQFTGLEG